MFTGGLVVNSAISMQHTAQFVQCWLCGFFLEPVCSQLHVSRVIQRVHGRDTNLILTAISTHLRKVIHEQHAEYLQTRDFLPHAAGTLGVVKEHQDSVFSSTLSMFGIVFDVLEFVGISVCWKTL